MDLNKDSGFLLTYKQWIEIGIIVLVTFVLTRVIKLVMNRFIKRSSDFLKIDRTRYKFFSNAINAVIYIMAIIFIIHTIPELRGISTTLFASAGVLAAVIGFASQQAVANIVGGVFVVLFRPFRVGDNIKVGVDLSGTVEDITLRHTVIKDSENARIIIPNAMINSQTVINYDIVDSKFKKRIQFNVSLDTDLDLATKLIQDQVFKHPLILSSHYPDASTITVEVAALTDRFVTLKTFVWTKNADDAATLNNDLNKAIFNEFKKKGIGFGEPQLIVGTDGKK
jgi:small conductance mechanosensitive channel